MKQSFVKITQIGLIVALTSVAHAQSVVPITTSTVIPTTAASPVVTSATTTTATTTTSTTTLYQIYMDQMTAEMTAAQNAAAAQAKATQRGQQIAAALQLGIQYCPFFRESQAQKTRKQLTDIEKHIGQQADKPDSKDQAIDTSDKKQAAEGKAATDFPEMCSSFIKDNGELGSVGTKLMSQVKENSSVFADKVPKDIASYCPKYKSMTADQRNMFWVWAMMSMAAHESSCDPTAVNKDNPKAVGLFQLDRENCGEIDLKDGTQNAGCAVKRLATEMGKRSTLFTKTAREGDSATYWAVLCTGNKEACGENGDAAKNTLASIRSYPECGASKGSAAGSKKQGKGKPSGKRPDGPPPGGEPPVQ